MPPILPHMEQTPTPRLRYSVGKISELNTQMPAKAAAAPNLPKRLNITTADESVTSGGDGESKNNNYTSRNGDISRIKLNYSRVTL